jgi:hypothetical protein
LNAPDQAAGKTLRCPKCQQPISIPRPAASDLDDVEDAPVRTPKRRPTRDEDEDDRPRQRVSARDEDDEEEDRPRKRRPARDEDDDDEDERPRRKKRKAEKSSMVPIILIAGVGLLVLVGGGLGVAYWLSEKTTENAKKGGGDTPPNNAIPPNNPPPPGPAVQMPAGWEKFNDPLNEIDLYFPSGQPEKNQQASDAIAKSTGGAGDYWMKVANGKVYSLSRMTFSKNEMGLNKKKEKLLFDTLVGFGTGMRAQPGEYELPQFDNKGRVSRVVVFDVLNTKKRAIVRGFVSGNRAFMAIVIGEPGITAKDADIRPFLDNMQPLK